MSNYPLFSVMGIELEYMLVKSDTLETVSAADYLYHIFNTPFDEEINLGDISVSNELVSHVIECKNTEPLAAKAQSGALFHQAIQKINRVLKEKHLCLLPTGAHPFMNPAKETLIWKHSHQDIYATYHKLFNCHTHGFANVQSMHINLPFQTDEDFFRLHNSIRLILPLLPAIAASSPIIEGKVTGMEDSRLYFYEQNQVRFPEITGLVIPEFMDTYSHYRSTILEPMFKAIAPFDEDNILQEDWLNSRGAIPKWDKKALEIRVLDTQECPDADIALACFTNAWLKMLINQYDEHLTHPIDTKVLAGIYKTSLTDGLKTSIQNPAYLSQLGINKKSAKIHDILDASISNVSDSLNPGMQSILSSMLSKGNLATRILKGVKMSSIKDCYRKLAHCLEDNKPYYPEKG